MKLLSEEKQQKCWIIDERDAENKLARISTHSSWKEAQAAWRVIQPSQGCSLFLARCKRMVSGEIGTTTLACKGKER